MKVVSQLPFFSGAILVSRGVVVLSYTQFHVGRLHLGVSKNRGTPKWMVKIMGNPYEQMDDLGVPLFLETPTYHSILWSNYCKGNARSLVFFRNLGESGEFVLRIFRSRIRPCLKSRKFQVGELTDQIYTSVIKHSNGKSPFSIGNTSSKGSFSIAMLVYQRVPRLEKYLTIKVVVSHMFYFHPYLGK